ncbi:MAG: DNA polymerase III subunit delta [Clostridia bacterium]|nr:DNA polymerase III subunit delta [Clostridia bacterium]
MAYKKTYEKNAENSKQAENELKRRLREKDVQGVYIFTGDEEYMKRHYFSELCKASGDKVNISVLRGDVDFGQFCDELSSVPMQEFSLFGDAIENDNSKRVIKLDSPDFSKLSDREMADVYNMLSDVGEMTIVVIYFSNIDPVKGKANTAIIKRLSENALVCDFQRAQPGDTNLLRWIKRHFDKDKIKISPEDIRYLCDSVGTDMCLLANETEKLCAYLGFCARDTVTREDIDYICIKNTEAITFDVTNAISERNFEKATDALSKLRKTKTEPLLIFGAISKMATDISIVSSLQREGRGIQEIIGASGLRDFVVKKYLAVLSASSSGYAKRFADTCLEADAKLKRRSDGYRILENLVFLLINLN